MTTPTQPRHRKTWTPEEDAYLHAHANTHSYTTLSLAMGRTALTIKQRCSHLGISRTADLRRAVTTNTTRKGVRPNARMRDVREDKGTLFDPSNPEHWARLRAQERELKTTRPAPVVNSTVNHKTNPYTAPELRPFAGRPGAMDAFALPSRRGGARYYRDGRVEGVA